VILAAVLLDAGPLTLNATLVVELIGFGFMILFLMYVPLPFLGIPNRSRRRGKSALRQRTD